MKKLIFVILSLGVLFTSNASADGFCPNWEYGEIVYMPGADQPNGSVAPKPYCWQVSDITGIVDISGIKYLMDPDYRFNVKGRYDSYYNFFGAYEDYAFNEIYIGIYVYVEVYGIPQKHPESHF